MNVKHALLTASLLVLAAMADAAEYEIHPSIAVSEEFTDNVFESRGSRVSDFITRLLPGISLKYKAPFWEWDVSYNYDYRYYARQTRDDDSTHNLTARGHINLVDNVLFFDVNDDYNRVSLNATRDVTSESLFVNQSDQNIITLSPYVELKPTSLLTLKGGYRFMNTSYRDPAGIDKNDYGPFADFTYEFTDKFNLTGSYSFIHQETDQADYDKQEFSGGTRYLYAENSYIYGNAGYSIITFSNGIRQSNPLWSAGITHVFPTVTANLSSSVVYTEDPLNNIFKETSYSSSVEKALDRGTLSLFLGYSEYVNAETDRLDTKRYTGTITAKHELSNRLTGTLGFTAEKYDQMNAFNMNIKGNTRKFFVNGGLNYLLAEGFTTSLYYRYIDYYSREIAGDNKRINRVIFEISTIF